MATAKREGETQNVLCFKMVDLWCIYRAFRLLSTLIRLTVVEFMFSEGSVRYRLRHDNTNSADFLGGREKECGFLASK